MGLAKHAGTCAAEGLESRGDLGAIVEVRTISIGARLSVARPVLHTKFG
jgi:hypothetical protein